MVSGMYVIYDKVKCECGTIELYKNDAVALRAFAFTMDKLATAEQAVTVPSDFKLVRIGEFDTDNLKGYILDTATEVIPNVDLEDI